MNKVNLQLTLNTDTKTKQESFYSARVVMYLRLYSVTGANALRSSPSLCFGSDIWRARMCIHVGVLVWRPEQRMQQSNLAMKSSQQAKTSNKQTVPNEESENAEGLPSKLLFEERITFLSTSAV